VCARDAMQRIKRDGVPGRLDVIWYLDGPYEQEGFLSETGLNLRVRDDVDGGNSYLHADLAFHSTCAVKLEHCRLSINS
jgi:hypothetical protein